MAINYGYTGNIRLFQSLYLINLDIFARSHEQWLTLWLGRQNGRFEPHLSVSEMTPEHHQMSPPIILV